MNNAPCEAVNYLRGAIGWLECNRGVNHPGMHFDRSEHLYWFEGAPSLERIDIDVWTLSVE